MLTVYVRMIAAALTGALASGAARAQPPRSWLDEQTPPRWNKPGAPVPAPVRDGEWRFDERCAAQARPASASTADRAVTAAGWTLIGPLQVFGRTEVVTAANATDGMCRPWAFQAFVFVDGRFAGTLSPTGMAARTEGSATIIRLVSATRVDVEYARYADRDPLCCPSGRTYVGFEVLNGPDGPSVVPTHARTESVASAAPR